jgi:hypothetical protein
VNSVVDGDPCHDAVVGFAAAAAAVGFAAAAAAAAAVGFVAGRQLRTRH